MNPDFVVPGKRDGGLDDSVTAALLDEACLALDGLAASRTAGVIEFLDAPTSQHSRASDSARSATRTRLRRLIEGLEPPSQDCPSASQCLEEVLKSRNTIELADNTTVEPIDFERLSLVHAGHRTVPIEPLLDSDTRRYLENPNLCLNPNPDDAVPADAVAPYNDPLLGSRELFLKLVSLLAERGLVVFSRSRASTIGVFTVTHHHNNFVKEMSILSRTY